ncbi:hypothetical protein BT93_G0867 [Corymbia citriodora subsp. variegata]|nr:hypothetical protein BT93_G0867 [Corymbia citriodora subsp. variegata]
MAAAVMPSPSSSSSSSSSSGAAASFFFSRSSRRRWAPATAAVPPACRSPNPSGGGGSGVASFPLTSPSELGLRVSRASPSSRFPVLSSARQHKATVVTKDLWQELIVNSEVPVLVEFYASWCGPCRMVHRIIDEIAEEYAGKIKCFLLNTDNDLDIAEDYDIKAVPVVLLFKNGQKRESVVGTMPKDFYVAAIQRVIDF